MATGESGRRRIVVNVTQPEQFYAGETTIQTNARMIDNEFGELWRVRGAMAHFFNFDPVNAVDTSVGVDIYAEALDRPADDPILLFQFGLTTTKPEGPLAFPLVFNQPLIWSPPLFMGMDCARPRIRISLESNSYSAMWAQVEIYYSIVRVNYYEFQRVKKGG